MLFDGVVGSMDRGLGRVLLLRRRCVIRYIELGELRDFLCP